jgi:hypothetical protein
MCLAGFIVALAPQEIAEQFASMEIDYAAAKIADLTDTQSENLFRPWNWPGSYFSEYGDADTFEGQAKAVERRIEHFIKTGQ